MHGYFIRRAAAVGYWGLEIWDWGLTIDDWRLTIGDWGGGGKVDGAFVVCDQSGYAVVYFESDSGGRMYFEVVGEIEDIETIAVGGRIRDIMRLQNRYGEGRWRKLKGTALVRLASGAVKRAEIHWYEAHSVGRRKMKIKRFLD
jgi:hypothetical protein